MISIYDMKNGEIVQRFGTKSVLDLCFIDEDAVASVEHSSSLSPYYNGWEMQESIYSLKDGKSLWQSQKTRITDTIAVDNPAAFCKYISKVNTDTNGEKAEVVGFSCEGNLTLVRKGDWDILFQKDFEYDIVEIQKIDDNNILVGKAKNILRRNR